MDTYRNEISLEGCIVACTGNRLLVCTGGGERPNCHSVVLTGQAHLEDVERTCCENMQLYAGGEDPKPVWIRLHGHLGENDGSDEITASVTDAAISFSRGGMYATADICGRLERKTANGACACAVISTGSGKGESLKMAVLRSAAADKWEEMQSGETRTGDMIAFRAQLFTERMSDGQSEHYRCMCTADTYRNLSLEQRQERKAAAKRTLGMHS